MIAAGRRGVVWFPATETGFADALTIAPPGDGEVRDVAVHDVDGDLALDVVAAGDVATRVYLQDGAAWTPAAWTGPAASTVETCSLGPGAGRELVLVTAAGVVAYAVEAGSIAAAPLLFVDGAFAGAACGDLDGLDLLDELVVSSVDGPIVVLDGDGTPRWSSATALDPPLTFPGAGVDAGDLDGDGDVDVVVAERGAGAPVHVLRREATAPVSFTHDAAAELAGDDHDRVELARLRPGP